MLIRQGASRVVKTIDTVPSGVLFSFTFSVQMCLLFIIDKLTTSGTLGTSQSI